MAIPNFLIYLAEKPFAQGTRLHDFVVTHRSGFCRALFIGTLLFYPLFFVLSLVRLGVRKALRLRPSVLWAPTPIINVADQSELMNRIGYKSKTLVFTVYYITDRFDYNLQPVLNNPAINGWFPNVLFLWSLTRFDIYHFFFDGGLWSGMKIIPSARWIELPLLRLAGKRIVIGAYGGDVRTKRRDEMWQPWNLCRECPDPLVSCICSDEQAWVNVKYHRDWANELIAMGDMHDYVYGSRHDFFYWPIDTDKRRPAEPDFATGLVTIAHSPNHRHFKGTRFVEKAVADLQRKGLPVQLDIIERVPNDEAMRRYAQADIVFTQCLAGWIGFTEIEAMALGKPVITHIRDAERYFPDPDAWPAAEATPSNMEDVLQELVSSPMRRERLGRIGRDYVERNWSFRSRGPAYKKLHEQMDKTRDAGIVRLLRRRYQELWRGERLFRTGAMDSQRPLPVDRFPVFGDPQETFRRLDWGIVGRPFLDQDTKIVVTTPAEKVWHPGLCAFYALELYHAGCDVEKHFEKVEKVFLAQAEQLVVNVRSSSENQVTWDHAEDAKITHLPEVPCHIFATEFIALPVMLRSAKLTASGVQLNLARELAGQIVRHFTGATVISGCPAFTEESLNCTIRSKIGIALAWVSALLAVYEFARVEDIRELRNSLQKVTQEVERIFSTRNMRDFSAAEYTEQARSNIWWEEDYHLAYGLIEAGRLLDSNLLMTQGKALHGGIIKGRLRRLFSGTGPL